MVKIFLPYKSLGCMVVVCYCYIVLWVCGLTAVELFGWLGGGF